MTQLRIIEEPVDDVAPEAARQRILAQHNSIRGLLAEAEQMAREALQGNRQALRAIPTILYRVRVVLDSHLSFEEELLLPILIADVPVGPHRARALQEEHQRQRKELLRMGEPPGAVDQDPEALAAELTLLIAAFLDDMNEEERVLLIPDVIRDDLVSISQESG